MKSSCGKHLLTEGICRAHSPHACTSKNAIKKALLDNKMLTSTINCTPWQWMQSMKSTDLIGHSKFLPWQQLDGCSMTRPFLSAKGVGCETRWQHHTSVGLWLISIHAHPWPLQPWLKNIFFMMYSLVKYTLSLNSLYILPPLYLYHLSILSMLDYLLLKFTLHETIFPSWKGSSVLHEHQEPRCIITITSQL